MPLVVILLLGMVLLCETDSMDHANTTACVENVTGCV